MCSRDSASLSLHMERHNRPYIHLRFSACAEGIYSIFSFLCAPSYLCRSCWLVVLYGMSPALVYPNPLIVSIAVRSPSPQIHRSEALFPFVLSLDLCDMFLLDCLSLAMVNRDSYVRISTNEVGLDGSKNKSECSTAPPTTADALQNDTENVKGSVAQRKRRKESWTFATNLLTLIIW